MKTIILKKSNPYIFIVICLYAIVCFLPRTFAQGSTVGLVGHWAMEDATGSTALVDSSSSGNNANLTAPSSLVSEMGQRGYGLTFDGMNDYAVVPDDASLDLTGAITLSAWVKPTKTATQRILCKVSGSTGYEIFLANGSSTGLVSFRINGSNITRVYSTTTYPIDGNTWMHVAATYDGVNMKLYINGVQEGGDVPSGNIVVNNVGLGIGDDPSGGVDNIFKGTIDDARVYNRSLSLSEIQELLTTWAPPVTPSGIEGNGAGYAAHFNGTTNYVTVPNDASLDITGSNITIEFWINPVKKVTERIVRKVGANSGYSVFLSSSGSISVRFNENDNYRVNTTQLYSDHFNEWIHFAATYDGSTIRTYFNGVPDNTLTVSFSIATNSDNLGIGATSAGLDPFEGQLDEVRVWNIARTQASVRNNMCAKLTGSESGLVGYWRFDETSGSTFKDETSNGNDGTLTNASGSNHVWSGAALGDQSSNDYTGSVPGDFSASIDFGTESFIATGSSGTITGIQVYKTDDNSLRDGTAVPYGYIVDPLRNWGVKLIGSGTPTYSLVYHYSDHPGIVYSSDLRVVQRGSVADPNWVDVAFVLDSVAKTLTIPGQTGTGLQYALASSDGSSPLPVELTSFSAAISRNTVSLQWRTATEVNNYGFEIQRSLESNNWQTLGFVTGHGNSNSPNEYSFEDNSLNASGNYSYRLKQVDNDGTYAYSNIVEVNFGSPVSIDLKQNYPNPFNPSTKINFALPVNDEVSLIVYNAIGEQVKVLFKGMMEAGEHSFNFNGEDLPSGLYIYKLATSKSTQVRKMMLLK